MQEARSTLFWSRPPKVVEAQCGPDLYGDDDTVTYGPRYFRVMVVDDRQEQVSVGREHYRKGLPGYHDPTAGIGGAPLALSALTLRLCLAVTGVFTCTALAIWLYLLDVPIGFVLVLVLLAVAGAIDVAVIVRRKRRGEPG